MQRLGALALVALALALLAPSVAAQESLCFVDSDGAEWNVDLDGVGGAIGTVQLPVGACEPARLIGTYGLTGATVPLHLFVPQNADACLPRSSLAGTFVIGASGQAEIIARGFLSNVGLTACTPAPARPPVARPWWSEPR